MTPTGWPRSSARRRSPRTPPGGSRPACRGSSGSTTTSSWRPTRRSPCSARSSTRCSATTPPPRCGPRPRSARRSTRRRPTAAPWPPGGPSSGPSPAGTASPRCSGTPRRRSTAWPPTARCGPPHCCCRASRSCSTTSRAGPTPSSARAADAARHLGSLPAGAVALAERALLAIDRRDWPAAESLADEAALVIESGALDDYVPSALVHAVAARTALHRGDVEAGREGAAHVARLRVGLTAAVPFFAVQTRLELVQAYLELADAAGARLILREVRDLLHVRPDLGNLAAPGRPAARPARGDGPRHGRGHVAHHRGAAAAAAPADPPHLPRDRRAAARVAAHDQDAGDVGLPEARGVVAGRGHRPGAGGRAPGPVCPITRGGRCRRPVPRRGMAG